MIGKMTLASSCFVTHASIFFAAAQHSHRRAWRARPMSARCRTKWIRPSRCPRKSRRAGYPCRAGGLDLQQHRLTKPNQPGSGDALQGALTTARGRFRQPFAWRFTLRRDRWGSTSDAKSLRASARDFPIVWPDTSGAISERDSKFESVSLQQRVCCEPDFLVEIARSAANTMNCRAFIRAR